MAAGGKLAIELANERAKEEYKWIVFWTESEWTGKWLSVISGF